MKCCNNIYWLKCIQNTTLLLCVPKRVDDSYVETKAMQQYHKDVHDPSSYRMVINLQKVNLKAPLFPTTIYGIDSILNNIGDKKICTLLDISQAFMNVKLTKRSRKYFCFQIGDNPVQYGMTRLCFGYRNSPIHWLRLIQMALNSPFIDPRTGKLVTENPRRHTQEIG